MNTSTVSSAFTALNIPPPRRVARALTYTYPSADAEDMTLRMSLRADADDVLARLADLVTFHVAYLDAGPARSAVSKARLHAVAHLVALLGTALEVDVPGPGRLFLPTKVAAALLKDADLDAAHATGATLSLPRNSRDLLRRVNSLHAQEQGRPTFIHPRVPRRPRPTP